MKDERFSQTKIPLKKKKYWDSFLTVTPPEASLKKLNVGVQ